MIHTETLTLVCRELRVLVRKLARKPGNTLIVPAIPENPPPPAGHFHSLPEIFIQTGGYTDFVLPWTRFRLNAGQTCIIPAYCPHEEYFHNHKTRFHYLVGMVGQENMGWHQGVFNEKSQIHSAHQVSCRLYDYQRLLKLIVETAACGSRPKPYGYLQTRGSALLTFAAFLEAIETAEVNPFVEHPKIGFCKQYIHNHLSETTLCVKTLAYQAECSPNYLSSLFHVHTGERITHFLNTRRLEQARDLLLHSTLNISEIARACGYTDPAYMTRRFVKAFHLSPRTYRTRYSATFRTAGNSKRPGI